jgi:hypothetical protein
MNRVLTFEEKTEIAKGLLDVAKDIESAYADEESKTREHMGESKFEGIVWHHPDGRMVKIICDTEAQWYMERLQREFKAATTEFATKIRAIAEQQQTWEPPIS